MGNRSASQELWAHKEGTELATKAEEAECAGDLKEAAELYDAAVTICEIGLAEVTRSGSKADQQRAAYREMIEQCSQLAENLSKRCDGLKVVTQSSHQREVVADEGPKFYALCIGMDDWTGDASLMKELFTKDLRYNKQHVCTLNEGSGPTAEDVLRVMDNVTPRVSQSDIFILYYSGHGTRSNEQFLFCTKGKYLPHSVLVDKIRQLKTERVVIIIDACHSGEFSSVTKDKPANTFDSGDLEAFLRSSGKLVMVAARGSETAPGSSAFTHSLIKAVKAELKGNRGKELSVRPLTVFDRASQILGETFSDAPLPRISAAHELASFSIGPKPVTGHLGVWHDSFEACSHTKLRCARGLGPLRIGKCHWDCCFSTDKKSKHCFPVDF